MSTSKITPKDYAKRLRVSPAKVLGWIHRGELRAINIASSLKGRPRFLLSESDIEEFESLRSTLSPQPKAKAKPRPIHDANFIKYY
jgi:hypothetical protein